MGRRRTKKRSPTTSDSSSGELTLPVGAEAELRSDDPGFLGSFYEVTITGHLTSSGQYTVVYSTLVSDDGGPLDETVAAANVRPRPPRAGRRRGFDVHEAVEAFHNEGWWACVVTAVRPSVAGEPRVYKVAFPTSRETMEFEETALRPHRVFQAGRWVPAAEMGDGHSLFPEGTQVEVSRSVKRFGESWRPASVLKVIGATNFLVKYTHVGNRTELATEILDSQYIRPAYTARKYRFSPSSRVEVMHEGIWWPCVILKVLGGGIEQYVVKLKSYETDMDDVECLDVLTVENTQLRSQVRWDGKTYLHRLEEKSATGPMPSSRKRPISCGLSLHKEVGETSDEHGSNCEKKLKNADEVSEPINESSEIKGKSSSYPGETVKQGNAVLAPPSLPLTVGFTHLSDSSLAQSSHLEQASSQKIIKPSALVAPQSRQLEASLFGTFGQTRSPQQGQLLGMQSLNPQTPDEVMPAKSIEEARKIVSMLEDVAKQKKGDDNVEPSYNKTVGCGMLSETNTMNCVDLTTTPTTPQDIGGSQHAVSQQDRASAMDDRLSESSAIHHLPFWQTSSIRSRIEAMEIFREMLQRPNLNQFEKYGPELREGMALGLRLSFSILAESIDRLDVHQDDIGGVFQKKKQGLSLLEENGFDVRALRSRLEARLCTTR